MKAALPEIRDYFQSLGVKLPNRVRVELASAPDIAAETGPSALGYTVSAPAEVLRVVVVRGLPRTLFGMVVAHEMGHAWLAGCPPTQRSKTEEEGICELLSSWWAGERGGRLAAYHLQRMEQSQDPVYGAGYRAVRDATNSLSKIEIVRIVTERGCVLGLTL